MLCVVCGSKSTICDCVFCVVIVVTSMCLVSYVSVIVCGGGDVWPGSHSPLSKWRRKKGQKCKRIIFYFLQECQKREKELFLPLKENVLAANSVQ